MADNAQQPQLDGEGSLPIIGGEFMPIVATIPVTKVNGDEATIQAGLLSGVTENSIYRLYDPDNAAPQNLPTLTISKTGPFVSVGNARGSFKIGDLVVEERHTYHFKPIKVYLTADYPEDKDKPLLQAIRAAFHASSGGEGSVLPAYALTDDQRQAEIRLHILHPKKENGHYLYEPNDVLPKSFPGQAPEVWVLSPASRLLYDNLRIEFDNPEQGIQSLQENLNKLARIRELKTLSSPIDKKVEVIVEVYQMSPVASCEGVADCQELPGGLGAYRTSGPYQFQEIAGQALSPKELLTFILRNESEEKYYCYLLNISPGGAITSIFPQATAEAEYAALEAGTVKDLTKTVGLLVDELGEETIKLIVSRQSIDVSLLENSGFQQRGGYRGDYNGLEQLLVNALYGQRSVVHFQLDEWATEQVSFAVRDQE